MITFTRSLAREVRAVWQRAGIGRVSGGKSPRALAQAGPDGLRFRASTGTVAVEYHLPGGQPAASFIVPLDLLNDCQGAKNQLVTLQADGVGRVQTQWSDGSVPQLLCYDAGQPQDIPVFPESPTLTQENAPELLRALADASAITVADQSRFALDCLELRGSSGEILATDAQQVLRQGGFHFPWDGNLLVPACDVFQALLPRAQPMAIGKSGTWIVLKTGPWTVGIQSDAERKFPKLDDLFRPDSAAVTRLQFTASDARFLAEALPRLALDESQNNPVTLDLNEGVIVRAADQARARVIEVALSGSRSIGKPVRLNTNRSFLLCAVKLGFRELLVFGPEKPIQSHDGLRQYMWMPLDPQLAVLPAKNAERIESPQERPGEAEAVDFPVRTRRRKGSKMKTSKATATEPDRVDANGEAGTQTASGESITESPLEQARELQTALRAVLTQTGNLIAALKRQGKQQRLMRDTLSSLKELQRLAG